MGERTLVDGAGNDAEGWWAMKLARLVTYW